MKRFLLLAILLTSIATMHAQERNTFFQPETANQQWLHYFVDVKLGDKTSWDFDAGYRWKDWFETHTQYIVRTGISHKISQHSTVNASVANLGNYGTDGLKKIEFRTHQQITGKHNLGSIGLTHRFRWEQRWFRPVEDGKIQSDGTYSNRFRFLINTSIPLIHTGEDKHTLISLSLGDELLLQTGKDVTRSFDQNRLLVGPVFHLNPATKLEFIYQGQTSGYSEHYLRTDILWIRIVNKF